MVGVSCNASNSNAPNRVTGSCIQDGDTDHSSTRGGQELAGAIPTARAAKFARPVLRTCWILETHQMFHLHRSRLCRFRSRCRQERCCNLSHGLALGECCSVSAATSGQLVLAKFQTGWYFANVMRRLADHSKMSGSSWPSDAGHVIDRQVYLSGLQRHRLQQLPSDDPKPSEPTNLKPCHVSLRGVDLVRV